MSELSEELVRAVKEATREQWILERPACVHTLAPPHDRDAEERIVSALLCGHVTLDGLQPLSATDCYYPLHRAVVEAAGRHTGAADLYAAVLDDLGGSGDVERALLTLRDGVPYSLPRHLAELVARVHEFARRRRLCEYLSRLDLELRLGQVTADEAITKIRARFERARRIA